MTDPSHDRARDRLIHLLRDYADAATEYNPTPPGTEAGNTILPGRWHFFKELDHWLRIMRICTCPERKHQRRNDTPFTHRASCTRPLHWHLNERYIRPHARTMLKPHTGKHLPPHTERATHHDRVLPRAQKQQVQAAPYAGTTMIARWHPTVDRKQVDRAIDWLLTHMYDADTTSINLPPDLIGSTAAPTKQREQVAA